MDDASYHRRRVAQHRRLLDTCDPRYAPIHRKMIELHEARLTIGGDGAKAGTADAVRRPAL